MFNLAVILVSDMDPQQRSYPVAQLQAPMSPPRALLAGILLLLKRVAPSNGGIDTGVCPLIPVNESEIIAEKYEKHVHVDSLT